MSDVVAVVLVILMTIAAVVIVWNVVRPLLKGAGSDFSADMLAVSLSVPEGSVKYSIGEQYEEKVEFRVNRGSGGGEVKGLNVVLENSKGENYVKTENIEIKEFETKKIEIDYGGNLVGPVTKISIAPIFKNEEGREIKGNVIAGDKLESKDYMSKNILNFSTWVVESSGDQPGFSERGNSGENNIVKGTGPYGGEAALWEGKSKDTANNDADGGWHAPFTVNTTKMYRFSVWLKKVNSQEGDIYFGLSSSLGARNIVGNNFVDNPYFWCGNLSELNKWYLAVGYLYPFNISNLAVDSLQLGGVYNGETGVKAINYVGNENCKSDFIHNNSIAISQYHRVYLYSDANTDDRQYFYAPRVDVVDGTEPSINALLGKE